MLLGFEAARHIFNLGHGILPETPVGTSNAWSPGCVAACAMTIQQPPSKTRVSPLSRAGSRRCSSGSSPRWRRSRTSSPASARLRPARADLCSNPGSGPTRAARPGGGGRMAMLRGRLFEKLGRHCSIVYGALPGTGIRLANSRRRRRSALLGAAGVSVIAHPWNPHVPTVHMNARLVRTTRTWFRGGADRRRLLDDRRGQDDPDSIAFHAAMRAACDAIRRLADAERLRAWCDEYFFSIIARSRAESAASSSTSEQLRRPRQFRVRR